MLMVVLALEKTSRRGYSEPSKQRLLYSIIAMNLLYEGG